MSNPNSSWIHAQFGDLDARDSDLQELPDAKDASVGNVAMLLVALVLLLPFALAAVVYVLRG